MLFLFNQILCFPSPFYCYFIKRNCKTALPYPCSIDRSTRKMRRIYIVHAKRNIVQFGKFDKMQLTIYRLFHRKGKCYIWFWIQFPNTRFLWVSIVSFLVITFFSTISIFTRMFFSKSWITKKSHLYSLQSLLKRKLARQIICSSTQYLLE